MDFYRQFQQGRNDHEGSILRNFWLSKQELTAIARPTALWCLRCLLERKLVSTPTISEYIRFKILTVLECQCLLNCRSKISKAGWQLWVSVESAALFFLSILISNSLSRGSPHYQAHLQSWTSGCPHYNTLEFRDLPLYTTSTPKHLKSFLIAQHNQMFKKPVKIGAQNQLSGKDRKTMRNKLITIFDEACVEKLLALNDKIISCKASGSKMLIYNGNDYPVFVDGTGKGDFFPSLYSVQAYEPLIKSIEINEGVESFIYNGANLMWPGVRSCAQLGEFKKDEVVGIKAANGEPIAIGAMGCSFKEFQDKSDANGVAVYILHYKNDKLWEMGPKTNPQVVIAAEKPQPKKEEVEEVKPAEEEKKEKKNKKKADKKQDKEEEKKEEKKEEKEVKKEKEQKKPTKGAKKEPSPQKKSEKEEEDDESDDADGFMNMVHTGKGAAKKEVVEKKKPKPAVFSDEEDDKKGKKKGAKKDKKKGGKKAESSEEEEEEVEQKKAPAQKKGGKKGKKAESSEEESEKEERAEQKPKSVISTKLMDQYLKECFLNAIKLSKVEAELPIDSGRFYIEYMLLARPEGVKLEVKDSSYKKLGKFYEEMSKQKFIEFKHSKDKKGQQGATINKIFWENKELSDYEPTIFRMNEKDIEQKEEAGGKKKLNLSSTLTVQSAYKPNAELAAQLFKKKVNYAPTEEEEEQMKKEQEERKELPAYYPEHEMRALIEKYINQIADGKSKKQKVEKMVAINYEEHPFIADLLKKEIEDFSESREGDEEEEDDDDDEGEKKKKGKKKANKTFRIDRALLVNKILKKCSVSHHMFDKENEVDVFAEGSFKGIQIVAEKSNNKNITKVVGLETFIFPKKEADEQLNWFAHHLQQKFACSVNIQNLPGKNAGKEIIAHGNFLIELEEMFTGEYGLKAEHITTQNKLDKKKKK